MLWEHWQTALTATANHRDLSTIDLNYETVTELDQLMREFYPRWLEGISDDRQRQFFTENQPVTVVIRYGQDRPFTADDDEAHALAVRSEAQDLFNTHRFNKLAYISFGTATTFRVFAAKKLLRKPHCKYGPGPWFERDANGTVVHAWASLAEIDGDPYADVSVFINLPSGGTGWESIPRVEPHPVDAQPEECGLLLNLDSTRRLQNRAHRLRNEGIEVGGPDDNESDREDDDDRNDPFLDDREPDHGDPGHAPLDPRLRATKTRRKVTYYPIALLAQHGNVQSTESLAFLTPVLRELNQQLRDLRNDDQEEEEEEEELHDSVWVMGVQAYNPFTHKTRTTTRDNDVAQGDLTAYMGSCHYTRSTGVGRKAAALKLKVDAKGLPADRFADKLETAKGHGGYRLEPSYHLDVQSLSRRHRRGDWIYLNIIRALARKFHEPIHYDRFFRLITIFRPHVFPEAIKVTAYPIEVAMRGLWEANLQRPNVLLPALWNYIETMSLLERLYMFATSGKAKVLHASFMAQSCSVDAMSRFLWPMFLGSLELATIIGRTGNVVHLAYISDKYFPHDPETGAVVSSASFTLKDRFKGTSVQQVSLPPSSSIVCPS